MAHVALISLYDEFCLGLRHVAGFLKQSGHQVTLIHFKRYARSTEKDSRADVADCCVQTITPFGPETLNYPTPYSERELQLLVNLLGERKAVVAGLSVPSNHKKAACRITREIRDGLGVPVVWGGVHPTVAPDDCFESEPSLGGLCVGEGEITFKEYVEAIERKSDLGTTPIAGMWLREPGQVVRHAPRPVEQNLDALGMQFFEEDAEFMIDEERVIHREPIDSEVVWKYKIMTGRGCPFCCSFCIHSTLKRRYPDMARLRRRSPMHVAEEIRLAKQRMPYLRMIEFEDDIFTLQREWLARFADIYRKEIALPFWCYTYPLSVNRANLQILKDMGIEFITMGIQSGSDRINRDVYDRDTPKQRILDAIQLIRECQIPAIYDIICDNPYESEHDLNETLDVITRIGPDDHLHLTRLAFLPATAITERAARDGLIGQPPDDLHRFYDGLFLLAQYGIADRETVVSLTQDAFLRQNPQVLWDAAKPAARARDERAHRVAAEQQVKRLEEKAKTFEALYTQLASRKAVRFSTALADGIRKCARALSRKSS